MRESTVPMSLLSFHREEGSGAQAVRGVHARLEGSACSPAHSLRTPRSLGSRTLLQGRERKAQVYVELLLSFY